jgi:hypothetical protein
MVATTYIGAIIFKLFFDLLISNMKWRKKTGIKAPDKYAILFQKIAVPWFEVTVKTKLLKHQRDTGMLIKRKSK